MRITDAGNVGIGTTPYLSRLHIFKSESGASPAAVLRVGNNGSGYTSRIIITDETTNDANISYIGGTGMLGFGIGSSLTQMVLTAAGDVGIGTSSPASRLHVTDAGAGASGYAIKSNGGILNGRTSINVTTTPVTLFTMSAGADGGLFLVVGDNGTNGFTDIVLFSLNAVSVVSSNTQYGSPQARTYSASGTAFRLALASGDLNIRIAMLIATA